MGIRVSAIFLMITLVAGFTSFPSSLSNYSTEIVDQPYSLNLINTAFADSDNGKGNDKEKGKPDDVGKGKDKEKKLAEKQAKDNEDNDDYEDNEDYIQEFNDAAVVHMSGTTTICHVPPGNPGNAHLITIGKPAVRAHEAHGDFPEACAENNLDYIQEFNDAAVVHMSGTTTICHVPPGPPGNAHLITIGKPAVRAH